MRRYLGLGGIIGSGKTTLAEWFNFKLDWEIIREPVEDNFMLEPFYADPNKHAFNMQIYLLHARYRLQCLAALGVRPRVMDRVLTEDRIFAKLHVKYGNITPLQWRVYEHCFNSMVMVQPPVLWVYLDVSPEVALDRVRRRGRECEKKIDLKYLTDLRDGYEEFIVEVESGKHAWSRGMEVMRVDWNNPNPADVAPEIMDRVLAGAV